eukprot:3494771-Ditylum_brightwellii.AAC.1
MRSPHLAVLPSFKVKSILLNHEPEIRYYNFNDPIPPCFTEEKDGDGDGDGVEQQEQCYNAEEDSDSEETENASDEQNIMTPSLQPTGMNIILPIPYVSTMEQFDAFQA